MNESQFDANVFESILKSAVIGGEVASNIIKIIFNFRIFYFLSNSTSRIKK